MIREPESVKGIVICYIIGFLGLVLGSGFVAAQSEYLFVGLMFILLIGFCAFYIAVKSTVRYWRRKRREEMLSNRKMRSQAENEAAVAKALGFTGDKLPTDPEEFKKMREESARLMEQQGDKIRAIREGFIEKYTPRIDYYPNNDKTTHNTSFDSIAAGREIADLLMEKLQTENGIHFETLFAYLGTMAGRECSEGLIQSLKELIPNPELRERLAGILDMMIARTTSDELFLLGDRVGDTFLKYYRTALTEPDLLPDVLLPLASKMAGLVGQEPYWETPYDAQVNLSLKEIAKTGLEKEFAELLQRRCSCPSERMTAYAFAAKNALNKVKLAGSSDIEGDPKKIAADILAEYGWRASHYIWNWE
ncbi:MAG: hypothetical protein Q4G60_14140 [bacterium]|nr:hypothetical protein [bacterium]